MKKIVSFVNFTKSTFNKTRFGRGVGSGKGRTGGRGHKGQRNRSGSTSIFFEGGQTAVYMRSRKRGFNSYKKTNIENYVFAITTDKLIAIANSFNTDQVNKEFLLSHGFIKNKNVVTKLILGKNKDITVSKISIAFDKITEQAKNLMINNGVVIV